MNRFSFTCIAWLCSLLSGIALAQGPAGMDQAKIDQMMQGMAQMAACYQNIDQSKMEALAAEGQGMQDELKQLCADGKRAEAQSKAIGFGMKMMASEEFKQIKECGQMAAQMMPNMPDYSVYKDDVDEHEMKSRHVCDDI